MEFQRRIQIGMKLKVGNGRKYIRYSSIALLPAACLFFRSWGQTPTNAQEPQVNLQTRASSGDADRLASIRINSDLVLIPVLVTDHQDRPITGLQRDHFKLYDDKVEQAIPTSAQRMRRFPYHFFSIAAAAWAPSCKVAGRRPGIPGDG